MTKWKYKTDGIGKNKAIREARKHPIPTLLMARIPDDELKRLRTFDGGLRENNVIGQDVQRTENDGE